MDHEYGYPALRKNIARIGARISAEREKEIIGDKERISKDSSCIGQIRKHHHSIGDIREQKRIDQIKDMSSKAHEKDREKTDSQRKRYQKTDG